MMKERADGGVSLQRVQRKPMSLRVSAQSVRSHGAAAAVQSLASFEMKRNDDFLCLHHFMFSLSSGTKYFQELQSGEKSQVRSQEDINEGNVPRRDHGITFQLLILAKYPPAYKSKSQLRKRNVPPAQSFEEKI